MEGEGADSTASGDPKASPGWYPDPRSSGNLFYWDGAKWTGDVRASQSPAAVAGPWSQDHPRMLEWAWAAVVAGAAAAFASLREQRSTTVRGVGLSIGLLGGFLATYALIDLRTDLRDAHGLATIGIGPYIAVGGCIAMVVGGLMAKSTSRPSP